MSCSRIRAIRMTWHDKKRRRRDDDDDDEEMQGIRVYINTNIRYQNRVFNKQSTRHLLEQLTL